ncbi:MAG: hypothetical protein RLY87_2637 [Chloroflexota bacterium]|jgi:5-amino-6-(5-phosphoribosylamino)uracil reductase/diaminohydroxyphosphoribosylaminopyrimidine deaminase/5-amino-6-(5-phosphoribosylamino)uracil reductase
MTRLTVTLAYAQTLDGAIAARDGSSRWISSDASLQRTHALRARHDAIMVGVGTVVADNPRLTVRLVAGNSPIRIVIDGNLRLPDSAHIINDDMATGTWIICGPHADQRRRVALEDRGVVVLPTALHAASTGLDMQLALQHLAARGIRTVMLEGGSRLITSMLRAHLIDRVAITIAPKIVGDGIPAFGPIGITTMAHAVTLSAVQTERVSDDIWIEGEVCYH